MQAHRRSKQSQAILLAGGGLLALCYFFMYRPLVSTSAALDKPLIGLWQTLVTTNSQDQTLEGLDLDDFETTLQHAQLLRARFDAVRGALLARLDLEPFITRKLSEPFQLIDFQNEREIRILELKSLAEQHSVRLDPELLETFPNYPASLGPSSLLWAQMALAENVLATAIRCGASGISKIGVRPVRAASASPGAGTDFEEILIDLELSGEMPAVSRFLASLPLRTDELVSMGLPEGAPEKTALFIERILLLKQSTDEFDKVFLKTVLSGYAPAYRAGESGSKNPKYSP